MVRDTLKVVTGQGAREKRQESRPVGVVDIGSNSIRLVVFEGIRRSPLPLFNEKVLCAIGRQTGTAGVLDPEGMRRATRALARFRAIAHAMGVERLLPVATAAVREAANGPAFVREASALLDVPVRVLSGEEEAALAADGVLSGIPDAAGLVGDLGGGSLELTEVGEGHRGRAATLPIGPLRLIDQSGDRVAEARRLVDAALGQVPWLARAAGGRPLYAVGGVWRSLARLHISQRNYPLHILQHYEIEAEDAKRIAHLVAGLSRKSLQAMAGLSRRRLETIPFGALVLERLIAVSGVARVVISAYGLREGLLFGLLSEAEKARDPLLEAARELARTVGRHADHAEELIAWTAPLFEDLPRAERRLLEAAALLSDLNWRAHPDYRAAHAFQEVQRAPVAGINHSERAFLALCVFHRYGGSEEGRTAADDLYPIAGLDKAPRALAIGTALRLGHMLSASMPGVLPYCPIKRQDRRLRLTVPARFAPLVGEPVQKRLAQLADALGLEPSLESPLPTPPTVDD